MNVEEKLKKLSEATMKQVDEECEQIKNNYEEKKDKLVNEAELELLTSVYSNIQREKQKASKEKNSHVLAVDTENKQKYTVLRSKLIDEIFDTVSEKVREYTKTEEYKNHLTGILKDAEYVFPDEDIEVVCDKSDKQYADFIKMQNGRIVSLEISPEDIIGGLIIKGTKTKKIYDSSFKAVLAEERRNFLKNNKFGN